MSTLIEDTVKPWDVTPEDEIRMHATDATLTWLASLSGEAIRPYLGKWIAARDCGVIAAADDHEQLLAQLIDIDLGTILIHRFEKPGRVVYR